jgi:hypothetical protein
MVTDNSSGLLYLTNTDKKRRLSMSVVYVGPVWDTGSETHMDRKRIGIEMAFLTIPMELKNTGIEKSDRLDCRIGRTRETF